MSQKSSSSNYSTLPENRRLKSPLKLILLSASEARTALCDYGLDFGDKSSICARLLIFFRQQHLVIKQNVPIQIVRRAKVAAIVYAKMTHPDFTVWIFVPTGAFAFTASCTLLVE